MGYKFNPLIFSGLDLTGSSAGSAPTIGQPVVGADPNAILVTDSSSNLQDKVLTNGQVLIGSTGAAPVAATITGTTNQVTVTNGAGSITLSLPQDIGTTSGPTFNSLTLTSPLSYTNGGTGAFGRNSSNGQLLIGNSSTGNPTPAQLTGTLNQVQVASGPGSITLSLPQDIASNSNVVFGSVALLPSGSVDTTTTGTLAIGTSHANIINIGNSGATVNIQGTVLYENVTQLQVKDPLITINKGGGAGSASNSGIEIEEGGSITAYAETSADRASWSLKAPSTAGIATITPGASGILLNQSSHDPVTLANNTNGLTISGQVLTLALASSSTTGSLTSTDYNTFNAKQPAGNYLTALTGDGTAAGPGSSAFTLATVNSSPGTTGSASSTSVLTTNAKGLVTSNTSTPIQITESQVTNLVTDLAGKQPAGNYITALTGDVTAAGPGSSTATLATVNSTPGTTGSASSTSVITVNAKGLVTSNTSTAIQITEAQVTGLTTDLAGKQPTGNYITALTGDATASGPGSATLTLATVNTNVGTFNNVTVNAKGLVTAASNVNYVVTNTGDVAPGSYSGLANNTSNQSITGLAFATSVSSFESLLNIQISATTNTFTTVKIFGTRRASGTWAGADVSPQFTGDTITGLSFGITSAGVVTISVGSITGFTSGLIQYRAISLS